MGSIKFSSHSKADMLVVLSSKLSGKGFKLPNFIVFSVEEWNRDSSYIIGQIKLNFQSNLIAIRSSSKHEDGLDFSSAGKYHSELNIDSNCESSIRKAIDDVISSYLIDGKDIYFSQVIVQEMITNPIMSGVLFSYELSSGAPYYVINYDDVTGRTDSVTSGTGKYSNRTLYIRRNGQESIRSERFQILIDAVRELEYTLKVTHIDIEFAMNDKLEPILLQSRSLTGTPKWDDGRVKMFESLIESTRKNLMPCLRTVPKIFGKSNIFGQMPDWNPAEMIGRVPQSLAYSLYEELITNGPWLIGRTRMGYHQPASNKLMFSFAGQPYIDVRLSFNSFLPANLTPSISDKLVNLWLHQLKESPHFHDKVEFEIVTTCYDFDFDGKAKKILNDTLDEDELIEFKKKLKEITFPLLRGDSDASIGKCLDQIRKLERKQNSTHFLNSSLDALIEDCINLGTIPFAMLARHGFIAHSILESLKRLEILNESDLCEFHSTTSTVASELVKDMALLCRSTKDKKKFFKKYGHLRPGTYDILSPRYSELPEGELSLSNESLPSEKQEFFSLNSKKKENINKLLHKEGCVNFSADKLIKYMQDAIAGREYGKFIFTRSVSAILENIANWGAEISVSRETLAHLSLSEIKHFQKSTLTDSHITTYQCLYEAANANRQLWDLSRCIRLPQLLLDTEGVDVVPFQVSHPNFISTKKIAGEVIFLNKGFSSEPIAGKVIMIENADPGFDWIFSQEILALITKYGGANSHMAIRCAEFGIPAAIGCGEQRFETLKKAKSITLDCSSRILTPLFQEQTK